MKTDEITTARRESTRLQEELTLLRESHSLLESQHSKMEAELDELRSGKGILRLMMSLADQGKALTALKNLAPGKGFDVVLQRKTAVEAECAISNTRPTAPEPDAGER